MIKTYEAIKPEELDPINQWVDGPAHYKKHKLESADIIDMLDLPRWLSIAFKHIYRRGHKDHDHTIAREISDIEKAVWYLNRHINLLKKEVDEKHQRVMDNVEEMKRKDPEGET